MRKIEKNLRKLIRSWVKYCKMLVKTRNRKIAIDRYNWEWKRNVRPLILRYYYAGSLTEIEYRRLFAYGKKGRQSI